ncbi:hypothetical protein LPJ64_005572 [Coemansia asiatica]|uniref:Uncharacterized protein n=1 Tax=Coemansia asiatica TaxID=1052880 RepID=A0A9W7XGX6_9FUNG|nr:hypothetical protein LPJ64_005572 [Coemansia asiatica]
MSRNNTITCNISLFRQALPSTFLTTATHKSNLGLAIFIPKLSIVVEAPPMQMSQLLKEPLGNESDIFNAWLERECSECTWIADEEEPELMSQLLKKPLSNNKTDKFNNWPEHECSECTWIVDEKEPELMSQLLNELPGDESKLFNAWVERECSGCTWISDELPPIQMCLELNKPTGNSAFKAWLKKKQNTCASVSLPKRRIGERILSL